jgi:hypothetical protein
VRLLAAIAAASIALLGIGVAAVWKALRWKP